MNRKIDIDVRPKGFEPPDQPEKLTAADWELRYHGVRRLYASLKIAVDILQAENERLQKALEAADARVREAQQSAANSKTTLGAHMTGHNEEMQGMAVEIASLRDELRRLKAGG